MFENGFLGTSAPLYMDIITLYFGLLPLLMGYAIYMAIKKRYELHKKMQFVIYTLTLLVVVFFEIGVRISGGFAYFMQGSNAGEAFLFTFLLFHIFVAFISVVAYSLLIYKVITRHQSHKKFGQIVYLGMTITSITGVMIYHFLFVH